MILPLAYLKKKKKKKKREGKVQLLLIINFGNNSNSYCHHFYRNPVLFQKQSAGFVLKKCVFKTLRYLDIHAFFYKQCIFSVSLSIAYEPLPVRIRQI